MAEIRWRPSTLLGRFSGWLAVVAMAFFLIANIVVAAGQRGGETFADNLWISIPMFAAGAAILAAGVVGGFAAWKGERAVPVLVIMATAALVVIFLIGEFTVRH